MPWTTRTTLLLWSSSKRSRSSSQRSRSPWKQIHFWLAKKSKNVIMDTWVWFRTTSVPSLIWSQTSLTESINIVKSSKTLRHRKVCSFSNNLTQHLLFKAWYFNRCQGLSKEKTIWLISSLNFALRRKSKNWRSLKNSSRGEDYSPICRHRQRWHPSLTPMTLSLSCIGTSKPI